MSLAATCLWKWEPRIGSEEDRYHTILSYCCRWLPLSPVGGKSLFLKNLCTLNTGLRELEIDSSQRTCSPGTKKYYTSFDRREASNSSTQLWYLWTTTMTSMVRCNSGTYSLAVTNSSLIGLKASSTWGRPCLVLETCQLPTTREVMDLRGEPATVILLKTAQSLATF